MSKRVLWALFSAAALVAWEAHLFPSPSLAERSAGLELAHGAIELVAMFVIALFALGAPDILSSGRYGPPGPPAIPDILSSGRYGPPGPPARWRSWASGALGEAGLSTMAFALLLAPSLALRAFAHDLLETLVASGSDAFLARSPWVCASGGLGSTVFDPGSLSIAERIGKLLLDGLERAAVDTVVVLPLGIACAGGCAELLAALVRGAAILSRKKRALERALRPLTAIVVLAVLLTCAGSDGTTPPCPDPTRCGPLDGGAVDATDLADGGAREDGSVQDSEVAEAGSPDSGPGEGFDDPCASGGPFREFDVSAIHVRMTLNRFGDHNPNGVMYVLDSKISEVAAAEAAPLSDAVAVGLRRDPIQPLVLRANLGECVVIRFTNRLTDGPASMHVHGLAHTAENGMGWVGRNPNTFAEPGASITYRIPLPSDPGAEHAYYFHDAGANRDRIARGLFGALVAEPSGSTYLDVETGLPMSNRESNWEAIIQVPASGVSFREFVVIYHEVGNEAFEGILDQGGRPLPLRDELTRTYRPSSRAINYRSEPFRNRMALRNDMSLGYSSYTFGDPATPIPRSYLGEPAKTRLLHGGSEVSHVHHLHGGATRWRRNPNADPTNDISSGLMKVPARNARSIHLDSQTIGPGTSYDLEHECGAGGCQQAAGDFLYHCHIGHHYISGMWGLWRVFDTLQPDLAVIPGRPPPPEAVTSDALVGVSIEGKVLTPRAIYDAMTPADRASRTPLEKWIEDQLPPAGTPLDENDATVWDWIVEHDANGVPMYRGEPETTDVVPNYRSSAPGARLPILFNPRNGRYAWPLKRPHPGKRPPFSGQGHGGTPWLGKTGTTLRPDGLCPTSEVAENPGQAIRQYPITAITLPIQVSPDRLDAFGKIFVLGDDKDAVLTGQKPAEPLAIRSNTGDCVEIVLTNELAIGEKLDLHTHFVQFDPQASDGVVAGLSYEQSIEPYRDEGRVLVRDAVVGSSEIVVNSDNIGRLRPGIWIGIGLGEGMCALPSGAPAPCTEVRRIAGITTDLQAAASTLTLDRPLAVAHSAGEAAGVEFVQQAWYSDVDTGTVFFHQHVRFQDWDHGLFGAHIIEPAGSTYHDPKTGEEVRSGSIVDIHSHRSGASPAVDVQGSFRELVLMHNNREGAARPSATINLRAEPFQKRLLVRNDPSLLFSSVVHGDPATPLPRAYVGDPLMIRNLGVVEKAGSIRVTGHRFRLERWSMDGALSDASPAGISERYDLSLDGGAGGPLGYAGDYLYYVPTAQDFALGAWGLIRVHDTLESDLLPLPDRPVPSLGAGFPSQSYDPDDPSRAPLSAEDAGRPCPESAGVRSYEVRFDRAHIVPSDGGATPGATLPGFAYTLSSGPSGPASPPSLDVDGKPIVREPLVLRVNRGECLEIALENVSDAPASLSVGKLLFDPQGSYGGAIGFNRDSNVPPGGRRLLRFFADRDLGAGFLIDLADPTRIAAGAFGGVVVEPEGAAYLESSTGRALDTGVVATIDSPAGAFREMIVLFHDMDPVIGQSTMPYPADVAGFSGLSYSAAPLAARGASSNRAAVFSSPMWGDPRYVLGAHRRDPIVFRVAVPSSEQEHVFSLDGHRFPLEPGMAGSEEVFARAISPGESFDAVLIGGAGGVSGGSGDFLVLDHRLPFLDAGLWALLRVFSAEGAEGPIPLPRR